MKEKLNHIKHIETFGRKASVDVKTNHGTYKMYRVEFNNVKHYDNWCSAISKWGHKIIGVRFDDGYPGIDGFKTNQNK